MPQASKLGTPAVLAGAPHKQAQLEDQPLSKLRKYLAQRCSKPFLIPLSTSFLARAGGLTKHAQPASQNASQQEGSSFPILVVVRFPAMLSCCGLRRLEVFHSVHHWSMSWVPLDQCTFATYRPLTLWCILILLMYTLWQPIQHARPLEEHVTHERHWCAHVHESCCPTPPTWVCIYSRRWKNMLRMSIIDAAHCTCT